MSRKRNLECLIWAATSGMILKNGISVTGKGDGPTCVRGEEGVDLSVGGVPIQAISMGKGTYFWGEPHQPLLRKKKNLDTSM